MTNTINNKIKLGIEIEFFNKDAAEIARKNNINITNYVEKKLIFNDDGFALTKEFYENMREVNIAFEENIEILLKKIKKAIELFNIKYPNYRADIQNREIPPAGMHISILIPKEREKDITRIRWRMLYFLAAFWQYYLDKYVQRPEKWEVYRFLRSHHINSGFLKYFNDKEMFIYKRIKYPYGVNFKKDIPIYMPVAIKKKKINDEERKILELRATPWLLFDYRRNDLKLYLNKIFEFMRKKTTKTKAINTYLSIYQNARRHYLALGYE